MRLTDGVASYDTALKLKTLGVSQESTFYWSKDKGNVRLYYKENCEEALRYQSKGTDQGLVAAYSVAELGELLPEWCSSSRDHDGLWEAYPAALYNDIPPIHGQPSEAEARGLLLVEIMEKYPEYPDQYYQAVELEEETHALV